MARDFVIGIGGTGARCVESLVHLCAAGIGPAELWAGFIDQDANHGNVARAGSVVRNAQSLHSAFHSSGAHHALPERCPLFGTKIFAPTHGQNLAVWRPVEDDTQSLHTLFADTAGSAEAQSLMSALYRRGDDGTSTDEHYMPLRNGFQGRPSVGAAVFLERENSKGAFWESLKEALRAATAEGPAAPEPARVLLIGSMFGGTGAAGVPTVGRILTQSVFQPNWNVRLSVVLLGPYFRYLVRAERGATADPDNFPQKLRGSLRYYANLLRDDRVFNRVYLVGWPRIFEFGGHQAVNLDTKGAPAGGPGEENPATVPELWAGMAALHFFGSDGDLPPNGRCEVLVSAFGNDNSENALGWEDLPDVPHPSRPDVRARLGQFIRFLYVFRYFFATALLDDNRRRGARFETWFRRLAADPIRDQSNGHRKLLEQLDDYSGLALRWWGGIDMIAAAGDPVKKLIDSKLFAVSSDVGPVRIELRDSAGSTDTLSYFAGMVAGGEPAASIGEVIRQVNSAPASRDARGLGRFVQVLYDACSIATAK